MEEITAVMDAEAQAAAKEAEAQKRKQQKAALIQKWADKVERARKHDRHARERWADDRRVARNDPRPDQEQWLVHTNLIGAILEVIAAFLFAKNPDVSVRPSQSARRSDKQTLDNYRALAETLEVMVSRILHDANLKRTAKRWVRSAMTVGVSWIKASMQTRTERDPLMEKELNDLQNNLARIEAMQADLASGEVDDSDAKAEQIRMNIKAIEGQLERTVAEGLVLDLMAPEDVVVAPDCGEVENYLNSPWIAFDLYKDRDDVLEITGWSGEEAEKLKHANLYTQRPRKGEDDEGASANQWIRSDEEAESSENPDGFYRVTEIWSLRDGVVYTTIDGCQHEWAREPYAPRTGARFYPNFALGFHWIDGDRWPQSDVYQLKSLQDEYNRIRSNYATHRMRAVPGMLFNERLLEEGDAAKVAASTTQEYIGVKPLKPEVDLRTMFVPKSYNQVDGALYNTEVIQQEMEKVSGAQDAVQGGIQVEKTATEAQILESGRGARTGARLDALEDALTELSEYVVQLMLQTMDRADAIRYAGPQAVWMDMTTDEALTLFNIEIKAGSTGKPKALSDREAWGTLMPLVESLIDRVGNARMMGQEWAAKPWIELLKESSKRLDDPLEIEKFLPEVPEEVIKANMNQELSEKEESEIRNEDADTLKKLAETLEKNPLFVNPAARIVQELEGQGPPEEMSPMPPPQLPENLN